MQLVVSVIVILCVASTAAADVPDSGEADETRGVAMLDAGNATGAIPILERALALREQQYGESGRLWNTLFVLGKAYRQVRDPRAETVLVRSLHIAEATGDPNFPPVGLSANLLGVVYSERGDDRRAVPLFEQSLRVTEKQFGPKHEEVYTDLTTLGISYRKLGDPRAVAILLRALNLATELWGETDARTGTAADSLGRVYMARSEWARAVPLLERAHRILVATIGEASPSTLYVADQLARAAFEIHDLDGALRILVRAQAQIGDRRDPQLLAVRVTILATGALPLSAVGRHAEAIASLDAAIAIQDRLAGPDDPSRLTLLHNLGTTLVRAGQLDRARTVMNEAVLRETKLHGPESPQVLTSLITVAELTALAGDRAGAEQRYRELAPRAERVFGKRHPGYAAVAENYGALLAASGRLDEAWPLLRLAATSLERATTAALQTGTEAERLRYVQQLEPAVSVLTALALDPKAPRTAVADALELTFGFKGRALEATAATAIALRRAGPVEQKLLAELAEGRRTLGTGLYGGDPSAVALEARVEELERQLANSVTRVIEPAVTLASVRAALPEAAALVEIVMYRPVDLRVGAIKWGAHRYVAYVLEHTGEPRQVDLGDGAAIDRAVKTLLEALADPTSDPRAAAREVDRLVMARIRPLLHTRWLYVSPDGALSAVPFYALVDERGHYAIEDYTITALTSGRDLLRRPRTTRPGEAVVFGDPAFGDGAGAPSTDSRASDLGMIRFPPLAGTSIEVRALGELFPTARVLTGAAATEGALKKVGGPPILHLATHGFFLSDVASTTTGSRGLHRTDAAAVNADDPLLRSGLAFAGANRRADGHGEDGILTALEASGLDLDGTRLVVLSACETGVGALTGGDGVRGLGRAFVLAGAETIVTSLWKVSDEATRDLMIDYYRQLAAGGGRGTAMRHAQLALLQTRATAHPYYWASFVVSGDASSLEGKLERPPVVRGSRGCGCDGADASPATLVAPLLVLMLLLRRRSR